MTRTLPLSEVKIKLSEIVEGIARRDDEVIITRNGKPVAVIMSADEHESWKATQEIKNNPELMRQIRESEKAFKEGRYSVYTLDTLDELFGPDSK